MEFTISGNRKDRLEKILKRINLPYEKEDELIVWMLFRQSMIYLSSPKNYMENLLRTKRIRKGDKEDTYTIKLNADFEKVIIILKEELLKAAERYGSGVEMINTVSLDMKAVFVKMLSIEIDLLYRNKSKDISRYKKQDYRKMKPDLLKLESLIDFVPTKLHAEMKKYGLTKQMMFYYFLLSTDLPANMDSSKITEYDFIKKVIEHKMKAMEEFMNEAEQGIKLRDGLDFVKEKYTEPHDLLAFYIRQHLNGNTFEEPNFSIREMNKELREIIKNEG